LLGGKDNFEVDRQFMKATLELFPSCLDIGRWPGTTRRW
jgi:hypothetical protein